jgi:hypothetical protein
MGAVADFKVIHWEDGVRAVCCHDNARSLPPAGAKKRIDLNDLIAVAQLERLA